MPTLTFYDDDGGNIGSDKDINLSVYWKYSEVTDSEGDVTLSRGSYSTSSKKTLTWTLTGLPTGAIINSIVMNWTPSASRSNSYITSSSYYGYARGRTYYGKSTSNSYVSCGSGTIDLTSYYDSSTNSVSATIYMGISTPPSTQSYAGSAGAGQAGTNYSYVYWKDISVVVTYTEPNGMWVGIDGSARKIQNAYIGVDGVARKIVAAWIGVDGVARKFYG